ncbi:LysR family transcriptional regulator [Streptomyces cellostaticus]|uniref:LysR family transcriptional regulator n=1 Tax=Streptomyces cellostaticus TaxID=67285 RepID=UPI002026667F|nr:LysR family transcriptional regulator [Streptomyces cellostaticus]
MDIQQIRCFLAVAEEQHFGRAAERLRITPSPLSRRIRDLENELGGALFVRTYHQVRLTPFGERLMEPAREALERFDALRDVPVEGGADRRPVRVGAAPLAAPQVTATVQAVLGRHAPGIRTQVELAPSAELLDLLHAAKLDLAVVHFPVPGDDLGRLALATGSYAVAMRADDPLSTRLTVRLADLADRPLTLTSPKVHPVMMGTLRERLRRAGVHDLREVPHSDAVQVAAQVQTTGSRSLIMAGLKHPSSRVFDDPAFTVVRLDEPDLIVEVGVVWREDSLETLPYVRSCLEDLRDEYAHRPMQV